VIKSIKPGMKYGSRRVVRILPALALALSAFACAPLSRMGSDPGVVSYEYRQSIDFVRIERIETGAPDNEQPYRVGPDELVRALGRLQVKGSISLTAVPVFNDAELEAIVPPLVAALAKAGPKEDVTFLVTGKHGFLGKYSSDSITTGRVFARNHQLNIVFGLMHELYQGNEFDLPPYRLGSRTYPNTVWSIVPDPGRPDGPRSDWVTLDAKALATPVATGEGGSRAGANATSAEDRYREIKNRLTALDRLKADGLITDEEYKERRRGILQEL
jgi:hypothetical protein